MAVKPAPPLTASQALQAHSSSLTGFEQSEILQYPEVYFWGLATARKHEGTPHVAELNHGCEKDKKDKRQNAMQDFVHNIMCMV